LIATTTSRVVFRATKNLAGNGGAPSTSDAPSAASTGRASASIAMITAMHRTLGV